MGEQSPAKAGILPPQVLLSFQWRALSYCLNAFGNVPLGQHFVHVTLMTLHARGWHPTIGELTAITGLTRPSVSRHVGALMSAGLIAESSDEKDARRRLFRPTARGDRQRADFLASLTRMNDRVTDLAGRRTPKSGTPALHSLEALTRMAQLMRAGSGSSESRKPARPRRRRSAR